MRLRLPPTTLKAAPPTRIYDGYPHNMNWFPGHMQKTLRQMQQRLLPPSKKITITEQAKQQHVNMVLEVRDARLPLTCINWKFEQLMSDARKYKVYYKNGWDETVVSQQQLQRFVVYSKCDLIDESSQAWHKWIQQNHEDPVKFLSLVQKDASERLLLQIVKQWTSQHPATKQCPPLTILVVGLPNTGKSSMINQLKVHGLGSSGKKTAAQVGSNPGQTVSISQKIKIVDTELPQNRDTLVSSYLRGKGVKLKVFVMDSPGVLPPDVFASQTEHQNLDRLLKIGLINGLPVDVHSKNEVKGVDVQQLADYMWWRMNNVWNVGQAVSKCLDMPVEFDLTPSRSLESDKQIREIGGYIALVRGSIYQGGQPDVEAGLSRFLKLWREGTLYRQMGILQSAKVADKDKLFNKTPEKVKVSQQSDRWKYSMLDDEVLEGEESIQKWFTLNRQELEDRRRRQAEK